MPDRTRPGRLLRGHRLRYGSQFLANSCRISRLERGVVLRLDFGAVWGSEAGQFGVLAIQEEFALGRPGWKVRWTDRGLGEESLSVSIWSRLFSFLPTLISPWSRVV